MNPRSLLARLPGAYARRAASWFGRRPYSLPARQPLVTFTFDDFPRSALFIAGNLLEQAGVRGTYFISHGLTGGTAPTGEIVRRDDLPALLDRGHEFGCHTFHHSPAWDTAPRDYETSVDENAAAHAALLRSTPLQTHSFPISYPRPGTKRRLSRRFRACRGCGQTFNVGTVDLNYLSSFFLEQSRDDFPAIERVIADNAAAMGWLIFSTHDVCANPTRYGVTPEFFAHTVQRSIASGARVVVMSAALDALGVPSLA